MKKQILKNKKGITLIALVVTIVVLLILAGVSIAMLGGEKGIITQAQKSKENTRGAEVKERVQMAANENRMTYYTKGAKKSRQNVIDELVTDKKLTDEEIELLETVDVITIGDVEIDFSVLGGTTTIGAIYSEDMVGKTINYTSDTALPEGTEWIVLGEDEDGSIMLTTSQPIVDRFTVNMTAEAWLSYEDDLHTACAIYGGTIQGQEIKSRSITLEDINRVTGFVEPEFNTYTFGSILDYENKKVDFYHPDELSENKWSKNETTYENGAYYYYTDSTNNSVKYACEGNSWSDTDYTTSILKNMDIITGENSNYLYFLASRSVQIGSGIALFWVDRVVGNYIGSGTPVGYWCNSNSDSFYNNNSSGVVPIRPIINLPSNIEVEALEGEWSIIY